MKEWLLLTIEMDRLCNKKLEKNEEKCQKEERMGVNRKGQVSKLNIVEEPNLEGAPSGSGRSASC